MKNNKVNNISNKKNISENINDNNKENNIDDFNNSFNNSRRNFLKLSALGACALGASSIPFSRAFAKSSNSKDGKDNKNNIDNKDENKNKIDRITKDGVKKQKVIILGIDGMDPNLLTKFVHEGVMPNFKKYIENNFFSPLGTTTPPQSPVAWASFITGMHPGKHGIFDFVHRDAKTFSPFLSTSKSTDSGTNLKLGNWNIPLKSGKVELLRRGTPFWKYLYDENVYSKMFKVPANFPVVDKDTVSLSGMGTPDLLGTYGTFTVFAESEPKLTTELSGGRIVRLSSPTYTYKTRIEGPENSFKVKKESSYIDFTIDKDVENKIIRINLQGQEFILEEGEWSPWVQLNFELFPIIGSVKGIVKFYVQKVQPDLQIYMTPINVDPLDPTLPLCYPKEYSKELADNVGRFYTQGFPEDTKALSTGIFSYDEFFTQGKKVLEENLDLFNYELSKFKDGVFFFYFTSIDQNSHMLLHLMNKKHKLYNDKLSKELKNAMRYYYAKMDKVLEKTLTKVDDDTTLIVMSDHGFAPFYREFNLSTWLVENGYTAVSDKNKYYESEFYDYVDWDKTKAYAMGINSIYLNLKEREVKGSVSKKDARRIKAKLIKDLESVVDPKTRLHPITKAYDATDYFHSAFTDIAPDIIVGYNSGYRISDAACLGQFPKDIFADRTNKWAADHCMDPSHVPGVFLTNRKVVKKNPHIVDLAPSILKIYGIEKPESMDGENIFSLEVV